MMKKRIATMVSAVIFLLATALPVSAMETGVVNPPSYSGELTESREIGCLSVEEELTVKKGAVIKADIVYILEGAKLTVEEGAAVQVQGYVFIWGTLELGGRFYGSVEGTPNITNLTVGTNGSLRLTVPSNTQATMFLQSIQEQQPSAVQKGNTVLVIHEQHKHEYVSNVCTLCGTFDCEVGDHPHTYKEGICTLCGAEDNSHYHSYREETGTCRICGLKCPHTRINPQTDRCLACNGTKCQREGHRYYNGKCTVCGNVCKNEFHKGTYVCPECGMDISARVTGSVLADGDLWIVIGIAVLAVAAVVALILVKKKPTTQKNDTPENGKEAEAETDEE